MMFTHLDKPESNPFGPDQEAAEIDSAASPAANAGHRTAWGHIASGAFLMAEMAVKAKAWGQLAQALDLAETASNRGSLNAALLGEIFGHAPAPDLSNQVIAACHEAGMSATPAAIASARAAVREHQATRKAAREAAEAAKRRDERRQQNEAARMRAEARAAALPAYKAEQAAKAAEAKAAKAAAEAKAVADKAAKIEAAKADLAAKEATWPVGVTGIRYMPARALPEAAIHGAAYCGTREQPALSRYTAKVPEFFPAVEVSLIAGDTTKAQLDIKLAAMVAAGNAIIVDGLVITDEAEHCIVDLM